jgi:hypothetical protein
MRYSILPAKASLSDLAYLACVCLSCSAGPCVELGLLLNGSFCRNIFSDPQHVLPQACRGGRCSIPFFPASSICQPNFVTPFLSPGRYAIVA